MKSRQPATPVPAHAPSGPAAASPGGRGNAALQEELGARAARLAERASAPLPHRERLEGTFGQSLAGVRAVFGGAEVEALLAERDAEALAVGEGVLFRDPNPGVELVAHEVAHVLQQRRGGSGGGEAEADAAAQAHASGRPFEVRGGAAERPQFSGDKGTQADGHVALSLAGATVTPPAFPGGLPAVHDWLMRNQAALATYEGPITVRFTGTVLQKEQVIWAYYHPRQTLVLEGDGKAVVTGFQGKGGDTESATPGYFLAYRPIIPQAMTRENPAAANLQMRGLTVRGFVSGGVEIDPRPGQMPSADTWAAGAFDPEAGHGSGGLAAWVSGAVIEDNTFDQMGTRYAKKGSERYAPGDPDGYKDCGYGGVVARGLEWSVLAGNTFSHLENRDSSKKGEGGEDVNWMGLIHGVYLRDQSSDDVVRDNTFDTISGAAVKLTNQADRVRVRGNTSTNAGSDAFVLEQYNPHGNPGGAVEADSAGYGAKGVGTAADGKKYIAGNDVGSAYSRWKAKKKPKTYREKVAG